MEGLGLAGHERHMVRRFSKAMIPLAAQIRSIRANATGEETRVRTHEVSHGRS